MSCHGNIVSQLASLWLKLKGNSIAILNGNKETNKQAYIYTFVYTYIHTYIHTRSNEIIKTCFGFFFLLLLCMQTKFQWGFRLLYQFNSVWWASIAHCVECCILSSLPKVLRDFNCYKINWPLSKGDTFLFSLSHSHSLSISLSGM